MSDPLLCPNCGSIWWRKETCLVLEDDRERLAETQPAMSEISQARKILAAEPLRNEPRATEFHDPATGFDETVKYLMICAMCDWPRPKPMTEGAYWMNEARR